jgi:DNA-binding CsgD family transcriptional regulator
MTVEIQRLFESLPPEGSIDELGLVIDRIRDVYDLEHVAYLAVSLGRSVSIRSRDPSMGVLKRDAGMWYRDPAGVFTTTSYDPDWIRHYAESEYKRIDPVIEHALRSFVPLDWRQLPWDSKQRRRLFHEAVSAGLGNQGYTIPIRGPNGQFAIFSVNKNCDDDRWANFINEKRGDLLVIAHYYHQKVLEIEKIDFENEVGRLSDREREVLTFMSAGLSRARVAEKLGISENTLRVYIDSARHKLGALNIQHAIAISIRRGIVNL